MVDYADFAPTALKLLRGVVYYDDPDWSALLLHSRKLQEYFAHIGLDLILSEPDGYAYLSQPEHDHDADLDGRPLPRLTVRRSLSFEVSLLCVLLREEFERFDPDAGDGGKVFLSLAQIRDRIRMFFNETGDEIRLLRELDKHIAVMERLRYIRKVGTERKNNEQRYEIMPIIKARVDPAFIQKFKEKMESYGNAVFRA